jgi:hypothetical protein
MRNLMVTIIATAVILFAGTMADAAPWSRVAKICTAVKTVNPVDVVACNGTWGRCRPGFHWGCGPRGCWCRPC